MHYSLRFSGNDYLTSSLDKLASGALDTDITLQCWFKTTDSGTLISHQASGLLLSIQSNGSLRFIIGGESSIKGVLSAESGFNDGRWYHISAVKHIEGLTILINGQTIAVIPLDDIETRYSDVSDSVSPFYVGAWHHKNTVADHFSGDIGAINIYLAALSAEKVMECICHPQMFDDSNRVLSLNFDRQAECLNPVALYFVGRAIGRALPIGLISVVIRNDSQSELLKVAKEDAASYFPEVLKAGEYHRVYIPHVSEIALQAVYHDELSNANRITIDLEASQFDPRVSLNSFANEDSRLVTQKSIKLNVHNLYVAEVYIGDNPVVVQGLNFTSFMREMALCVPRDQVTTLSEDSRYQYNEKAQVFNRKFQFKPLAIVECITEQDVANTFKCATRNNLPIRVRSGGHDHEGECSANDTIVIDLSQLTLASVTATQITNEYETDQIKFEGNEQGIKRVRVTPGVRFETLTTVLAQNQVMIPHGTCATVAIGGFIMGGGWGPWTRKHGMCCESLVRARILLGDGTIHELTINPNEKDLLWALKGGGGLSYGIITELVIDTFDLPKLIQKFELSWNPYQLGSLSLPIHAMPTLDVLRQWEAVIKDKSNVELIGTNLKVSAKHSEIEEFDYQTVTHKCVMYGYFDGNETQLREFVNDKFGAEPLLTITGVGGSDVPNMDYGLNLASSWDRESLYNIRQLLSHKNAAPIPPDLDDPAPHKITSRLVDANGLACDSSVENGYEALLKSLTSSLLGPDNVKLGLFSYVTLGAITGEFYQNEDVVNTLHSAFPYKDRLYTIQYQTWWNEKVLDVAKEQDNKVYLHLNRALDWMDDARDCRINGTGGAFISFKDSSIPTKTYFSTSYIDLMKVKQHYSIDPLNHFRTRKTIL